MVPFERWQNGAVWTISLYVDQGLVNNSCWSNSWPEVTLYRLKSHWRCWEKEEIEGVTVTNTYSSGCLWCVSGTGGGVVRWNGGDGGGRGGGWRRRGALRRGCCGRFFGIVDLARLVIGLICVFHAVWSLKETWDFCQRKTNFSIADLLDRRILGGMLVKRTLYR